MYSFYHFIVIIFTFWTSVPVISTLKEKTKIISTSDIIRIALSVDSKSAKDAIILAASAIVSVILTNRCYLYVYNVFIAFIALNDN